MGLQIMYHQIYCGEMLNNLLDNLSVFFQEISKTRENIKTD